MCNYYVACSTGANRKRNISRNSNFSVHEEGPHGAGLLQCRACARSGVTVDDTAGPLRVFHAELVAPRDHDQQVIEPAQAQGLTLLVIKRDERCTSHAKERPIDFFSRRLPTILAGVSNVRSWPAAEVCRAAVDVRDTRGASCRTRPLADVDRLHIS